MREIKFRAWDEIQHRMVYSGGHDKELMEFFYGIDDGTIDPTGLDIMQYTGNKDKKGKEVYEGDIVRCVPPFSIRNRYGIGEFYSKVYFAGGCFCVNSSVFLKGEPLSNMNIVEVVGNIYENPELLEEVEG